MAKDERWAVALVHASVQWQRWRTRLADAYNAGPVTPTTVVIAKPPRYEPAAGRGAAREAEESSRV